MKFRLNFNTKFFSILLPIMMVFSLTLGGVAVYSATSDTIDNPVADSYQEADFLNTKCRVIAGGVASVCEPLNFANQFMASSGKLIGPLLKNNTANDNDFKIGSCSNAGGVESICSAIQSVSYAIIIFLFILLIFGNTFSGVNSRIFDSYSIKKTLPKLLIAIAGITFGSFLIGIVVDVINIVSANFARLFLPNVSSSITDPYLRLIEELFVKLVNTSTSLSTSDFSSAFAGITLLTFISLTGTVMVLLTLAIRFVALSVLVVTIPLAFALSSLPSTASYIKKSFALIITILLMEPITIILFAVSYSALKSIPSGSSASSAERTLLTMLFATIPFFIVPFTYKLAKGLLDNGANVYNSFRPKIKFDHDKEKITTDSKNQTTVESNRVSKNTRDFGNLPNKTIALNSKNSERITSQLNKTQATAENILNNKSESLSSNRSIDKQYKEAELNKATSANYKQINSSPNLAQNSPGQIKNTPGNELNGRRIESSNQRNSMSFRPEAPMSMRAGGSPTNRPGEPPINRPGVSQLNLGKNVGAKNNLDNVTLDKFSTNSLADKIGHSINANGKLADKSFSKDRLDALKGKDRLQPTNPELEAKRKPEDINTSQDQVQRKIDKKYSGEFKATHQYQDLKDSSQKDEELIGAKIDDQNPQTPNQSDDLVDQPDNKIEEVSDSEFEDLGQVVIPDQAVENITPNLQADSTNNSDTELTAQK